MAAHSISSFTFLDGIVYFNNSLIGNTLYFAMRFAYEGCSFLVFFLLSFFGASSFCLLWLLPYLLAFSLAIEGILYREEPR